MAEVEGEGDGEVDGPVDFTIKSEHSSPPPTGDMTDIATFLASSTAAGRTSNQVGIPHKGTIISNNPPCKYGNARFTTLPSKTLSDQVWIRYRYP